MISRQVDDASARAARQRRLLASATLAFAVSMSWGGVANAVLVTTNLGKVVRVVGNSSPDCRAIEFRDNATGVVTLLRVAFDSSVGSDTGVGDGTGIMAVSMTALASNRDVRVLYDTALTSGCGTESKVLNISIY